VRVQDSPVVKMEPVVLLAAAARVVLPTSVEMLAASLEMTASVSQANARAK